MVIEKQLIERGIDPFLSILFTPLPHHGGFTDTTGSFYHYEPVAPCNLIVQITPYRCIEIFSQAGGNFIYSFHSFHVFTKLQLFFFTKKEKCRFLFFLKKNSRLAFSRRLFFQHLFPVFLTVKEMSEGRCKNSVCEITCTMQEDSPTVKYQRVRVSIQRRALRKASSQGVTSLLRRA